MSHEVLITRRQCIFIFFFANPGSWRPQLPVPASTGLLRPASAWICKKKLKCFVLWLSGPHGTSNFDHQTLIRFTLNYTTPQWRLLFCQKLGGQLPTTTYAPVCLNVKMWHPLCGGCCVLTRKYSKSFLILSSFLYNCFSKMRSM